jgi:hypothetical protein
VAGRSTCPSMRVNHLLPRLSLNCTRNFTSSNQVKSELRRPRKSAKVASEGVSESLLSPTAVELQGNAFKEEHPHPLATSLNHYFNLPPLPPTDDWLSRFAYTTPQLRDRISIRDPVSAIRVARSFINSTKISTGNSKIIIEAFPGVHRHKVVVTLLSHPV